MPDNEEDLAGVVWVRTEPTPDGTGHMATVSIGEDFAMPLDAPHLGFYISNMMKVVAEAEFDASVFQQIHDIANGDIEQALQDASEILRDLRAMRPEIDWQDWRLRFKGGVTKEGKAFAAILVDDEPVGQWNLMECREHVLCVMEAVAAAQLDQDYLSILMDKVGLPENPARGAVEGLHFYREKTLL